MELIQSIQKLWPECNFSLESMPYPQVKSSPAFLKSDQQELSVRVHWIYILNQGLSDPFVSNLLGINKFNLEPFYEGFYGNLCRRSELSSQLWNQNAKAPVLVSTKPRVLKLPEGVLYSYISEPMCTLSEFLSQQSIRFFDLIRIVADVADALFLYRTYSFFHAAIHPDNIFVFQEPNQNIFKFKLGFQSLAQFYPVSVSFLFQEKRDFYTVQSNKGGIQDDLQALVSLFLLLLQTGGTVALDSKLRPDLFHSENLIDASILDFIDPKLTVLFQSVLQPQPHNRQRTLDLLIRDLERWIRNCSSELLNQPVQSLASLIQIQKQGAALNAVDQLLDENLELPMIPPINIQSTNVNMTSLTLENEDKIEEDEVEEDKVEESKVVENKIDENKIDENKIDENKIDEDKLDEVDINEDEINRDEIAEEQVDESKINEESTQFVSTKETNQQKLKFVNLWPSLFVYFVFLSVILGIGFLLAKLLTGVFNHSSLSMMEMNFLFLLSLFYP